MRRGVDCLKSYFEIGGHIIECDIDNLSNTSLLSSKSRVPAAGRPERGRISARDQSSTMTQTSKDSLGTHALKMWTYNIRSGYDLFTEKPESILGFIKDPRTLGVLGIQWSLDTIELNYDYFVKGESSPW
jgi:hypothetical protein